MMYLKPLLFVILLFSFVGANEQVDPFPVQTYSGEILSIQKFSFANRPVPHTQLILRTNGHEYTVDLGPEGYLSANGISINPMQHIEVLGTLLNIDGQEVIVAHRITIEGQTFNLRDEYGTPLWRGWRRKASRFN